jgi:hypothetical protein
VTTSSHCDAQIFGASKINCMFDVSFVGTAHNKTGATVELGVPDAPCGFVGLVLWTDDWPVHSRNEVTDGTLINCVGRSTCLVLIARARVSRNAAYRYSHSSGSCEPQEISPADSN